MAGLFIGKPFTDYTLDDYLAITGVNLTGGSTSPSMCFRRWSTSAAVMWSTSPPAWSTMPTASGRPRSPALTKGGLDAVTRSLAIEYASRGVRVNAVSPGVIKTPLHDPASYDGLAAIHPLGRVGEIDDVVDAILYLERAAFVTGETLHVDGGQAAGH